MNWFRRLATLVIVGLLVATAVSYWRISDQQHQICEAANSGPESWAKALVILQHEFPGKTQADLDQWHHVEKALAPILKTADCN